MQSDKNSPHISVILLAFLAIYIVWGSTYLCNKILVYQVPPFFLSGSRFVLAGILVGIWCAMTGRKVKLTGQKLSNAIVAGFLFLTLGNGCLVYGLQYLDSGFTALLVSVVPLVVLVMMYIMKGTKIGMMSLVGIGFGLLGIYLLVAQEGIDLAGSNWIGLVGVSLSLIAWSYASIYVGERDLPSDSLINTGIQMLAGGIMLFIISLLTEFDSISLSAIDTSGLLSFAFLVIFGSIVAFTAFNFLLLHVSPEKVATSGYVNPIVAMVLGYFFLDEAITEQSMIAALILLIGVYFVNSSKHKKTTVEE